MPGKLNAVSSFYVKMKKAYLDEKNERYFTYIPVKIHVIPSYFSATIEFRQRIICVI
jgi:hypothetical protein